MDTSRHLTVQSSRMKGLSGKKVVKFLVVAVVVIVPVFLLLKYLTTARGSSQGAENGVVMGSNSAILATSPINVEIPIPIPDSKGTTIGELRMTVEAAEKRDEIIVKGKKAYALEGRDFLIVGLKIVNPMDKGIQINTRDFFRLNVNGSGEWLAPDIHNDPVEVQAISTKATRIGFPVNEGDSNLILQIGLIDGAKQQVPLSF